MNKIFKLTMFFIALAFTLVLSLLSEPNIISSQQVSSNNFIQHIEQKTDILISGNVLKGEISSQNKDSYNGLTGTCPFIKTYKPSNDLSKKITLQFNKDINYLLSNNEENIQDIRAP